MKIFTAKQMCDLDTFTIQSEAINSIDLMERAAIAVAEEIQKRWTADTPIMVLAGPGNNGGDALAVARLLSEKGYEIDAYLFNTGKSISNDCAQNKARLKACRNLTFTEVTTNFTAPPLSEETLIIDGLFGTGLNKPLSGGFAALVKFINASPAQIVAIDMPSGLMCESNADNDLSAVVCADLTLSFQVPKPAFLLPDTQAYIGEYKILDIGLSAEKIADTEAAMEMLEREEIRSILRPRFAFAHKGTFGNALLIAGKYGMAGCAVLAAKAALRSGCGKVTLHSPTCNNDILQISVPEAILHHDSDEKEISSSVATGKFSAVGIGPGIGTSDRTAKALFCQLHESTLPMVLDADALNIIGNHKNWLKLLPQESILTPHPAEFKRLGSNSVDAYTMLLDAVKMAEERSVFVVLKGHHTAICTPMGKIYFNSTGNSGMASAGSGDVLTGIIVSLLAQGYSSEEACKLGVYIHGLAGDLAANEKGEISLTASDLIDFLPKAFTELQSTKQS